METLASPYSFALFLHSNLSSGTSLRSSLHAFVQINRGKFSRQLNQWYLQGAEADRITSFPELCKNPYRLGLMYLVCSGLKGQSIHQPLQALTEEMHEASLGELEEDLRKLPIKMMLPLLLFQFPAFLVLLFGPIMTDLLEKLGS